MYSKSTAPLDVQRSSLCLSALSPSSFCCSLVVATHQTPTIPQPIRMLPGSYLRLHFLKTHLLNLLYRRSFLKLACSPCFNSLALLSPFHVTMNAHVKNHLSSPQRALRYIPSRDILEHRQLIQRRLPFLLGFPVSLLDDLFFYGLEVSIVC